MLGTGRNGAELGALRLYFRTTGTGRGARFEPFFVSLGPPSPKQPNHGHFGTDVESSIIQRFGGRPEGVGFERAPLRRSEQGSNCPVQRVRYSVVSAALPSAGGRDDPPARRARVDPPRTFAECRCNVSNGWGAVFWSMPLERLSAAGRRRRQWRPERRRPRAAAETSTGWPRLKCGDIESGSSHFLPSRPCQGSGPGSRPAATSASRSR